ncbi:hypothetical protein LSUE1_G006604 [Lachnellula suecica]|uniref:N-alpha-acetyltransferase 40 n=1 Tax=Lachnellula suecica TaxID=602035 RepID=A0A8T9BXS8_9HELO|nr:hypothetical protein LSUE1_G006604 [Lachnellula suecica]
MEVDLIDIANKKTLDEFIHEYLPPNGDWKTWTHPTTKAAYTLSLKTAASLTPAEFDACFHLIEFTSSADYRKSKDGWKPRSKRKEMKLLDLKYLLVKTGLGTVLMRLVESIAVKIPSTEKVMLTCFTCNEKAVRFYGKAGFSKDEFSPPPKTLRNGTKVEEEYVILSKAVSR